MAPTRLLLDTSVLLRLVDSNRPLPESLVEGIRSASVVFMSPLSLVEVSLKISVGKLELPKSHNRPHPAEAFWYGTLERLRARELAFTAEHARRYAFLPLHHKDPFDRMILAQALAENLAVATTDAIFAEYGVRLLTA